MTNSQKPRLRDRRAFLKYLAGSPYIAALGGVSAVAFQTQQSSDVISNPPVLNHPNDGFNVLDFEEAAHRKVNPGHWAYMASGVDDDATLKANREGFKHV
jgi:4-hydroxymandelate oxidase